MTDKLVPKLIKELESRIKQYNEQYLTAYDEHKSMIAAKNVLCRDMAKLMGYKWNQETNKLVPI